MTKTLRRPLFAFTLGAALAAAFLLGRAAFASEGTISACFKPSNGTLYLLGDGSGRTACQPGDIPISWNAAGLQGPPGEKGDKGDPGDPFSGTFTSPSGQYRLTVADDGIRLEGPTGRLHLVGGGVTLDSGTNLTLRGTIQTAVTGGTVSLNGVGCGVLRAADFIPAGTTPPASLLANSSGSATVRFGC